MNIDSENNIGTRLITKKKKNIGARYVWNINMVLKRKRKGALSVNRSMSRRSYAPCRLPTKSLLHVSPTHMLGSCLLHPQKVIKFDSTYYIGHGAIKYLGRRFLFDL